VHNKQKRMDHTSCERRSMECDEFAVVQGEGFEQSARFVHRPARGLFARIRRRPLTVARVRSRPPTDTKTETRQSQITRHRLPSRRFP